MLLKVFSIFDTKGGFFTRPFVCHTRGQAIREVMDLLAAGGTQFSRYPEDFALNLIGEFEDSVGALLPLKSPEFLGYLTEFKKTDVSVLSNTVQAANASSMVV